VEAPSAPAGEPVAYNDRGVPTIVREVDANSGQARTIVRNEDGSQKVFGGNTIASLVGSPEADARQWIGHLKDRELRGLVHELGKRLVEASRVHCERRTELERIAQQANFAYFGLSAGAEEKDLHAAYRRLAKRMHPDKCGGTDEAKQKFQHMKEKYERLKERYREQNRGPEREEAEEEAESSPAASETPGASAPEKADGAEAGATAEEPREEGADHEDEEGDYDEEASGEEEAQDAEGGEASPAAEASQEGGGAEGAGEEGETEDGSPSPQGGAPSKSRKQRRRGSPAKGRRSPHAGNPPRREAYDEDEDASPPKRGGRSGADKGRSIQYDPTDRSSMDATIWRMREQMSRLQSGLGELDGQLRRARGY